MVRVTSAIFQSLSTSRTSSEPVVKILLEFSRLFNPSRLRRKGRFWHGRYQLPDAPPPEDEPPENPEDEDDEDELSDRRGMVTVSE